MLSKFDELVKQRNILKNWWELRTTIARYDESHFKLRVDVARPTMVSFCGQHTSGGKNYHDAPDFFVDAVRREFAQRSMEVTKAAYEAEIDRLNAEIEKHRAEVLEMLEVDSA